MKKKGWFDKLEQKAQAKAEKQKISEKSSFSEMLEQVPIVKTNWWWEETNDPKNWGPYAVSKFPPKSTAAEMATWADAALDVITKEQWLAYKKTLEQKMLYGSGAWAQGAVWSVSASSNHDVQIYSNPYQFSPSPMTYEKAVALNNGD